MILSVTIALLIAALAGVLSRFAVMCGVHDGDY